MTIAVRDIQASHRDELRIEPITKRIRGVLDGATVLDSVRARLVWEPRRLLCEYAVPVADLIGLTLADAAPGPVPPADGLIMPDVPFATHSTAGTPLDVRAGGRTLTGAAFGPTDAALDGYVLLDFAAFDEWFHEDERNVGHPRDPYHRVEALPSSRHIRVQADGVLIAESDSQVAIYESNLPARFYLPPRDVRVELRPSDTHTWCAYKGEASYVSVVVGDRTISDAAWFYPDSLPDSQRAQGFYCFDDSKVDVTVTPS